MTSFELLVDWWRDAKRHGRLNKLTQLFLKEDLHVEQKFVRCEVVVY